MPPLTANALKTLLSIPLFCVSIASQALTITPVVAGSSNGSQTAINGSNPSFTLDYTWSVSGGEDATLFTTFSTEAAFNITLLDYTGGTGNQRSGFILLEGTPDSGTPLAVSETVCTGAGFGLGSGTSNNGSCDFISGTNATAILPGELLASNLVAGTYTIAFFEGNASPQSGTVRFGITAVPLPAAAWLFGSALLGVGMIRRRRTATA